MGWHNDHLSPLISGHLGPQWAMGNRARGLAEALCSVMNGVKAKSTRHRVKLKGTVPGSAKLQGTSVRVLQWTLCWSTFINWLNRWFWGYKRMKGTCAAIKSKNLHWGVFFNEIMDIFLRTKFYFCPFLVDIKTFFLWIIQILVQLVFRAWHMWVLIPQEWYHESHIHFKLPLWLKTAI